MPESNSIEIAEIADALAGVQKSFSDIDHTSTLQEMSKTLENQHAEYFDSQNGPGGASWPRLRPRTVVRKGHDRILIDTGRLRSSLDGNSGDAVREISADGNDRQELLFGTSVPYSALHQFGWGIVPARPHVGTDESTVSQFVEDVADATVKALQSG